MKLRAYSSISAFLAHYHALRAGAGMAGAGAQRPPTADERRVLAEMDALLRDTFTEGERVALGADGPATTGPATNGAAARRSARAELKLWHALAARGLLTA